MILLEEIRAVSQPGRPQPGSDDPPRHGVDLHWANREPENYPGIRVVRREQTHPTAPDDGTIVFEGLLPVERGDERGRAHYRFSDRDLVGGRVYYYSLFPYRGVPPEFEIDRAHRVSALAASVEGAGQRMYELLPALYRRYDARSGQLRNLLELAGDQLDTLESYARFVLDFYALDRTDGALLPLLAHTIGWSTDFRLEVDRQRNEIRQAPSLYRRIGLIPTVSATVQRLTGWESRAKEFVHNIARTNHPPRLNLWARHSAADGTLQSGDALLSLDDAYEGRPSGATDGHGIRWLFYHTRRQGHWRICFKTSPTFRLGLDAGTQLEDGDMAGLQRSFAAAGVELAADAAVTASADAWHVEDTTHGQTYVIEPGTDALLGYHTSADPVRWAPSRPLDPTSGLDDRHPAAALQGETLWLFWDAYDRATGLWALQFRVRQSGTWSETHDRLWEAPAAAVPERRMPAAVTDEQGALWLFWLERSSGRWGLRYNRHDGTDIDSDLAAGWELDPPADFPPDGAEDPRVDGDVSVLFHPDDAARPLWVFWSRKEPAAAPAQTRWAVMGRSKDNLDPMDPDWSAVRTLTKADADVHDREPAARVNGAGDLEVYWASDRDGSWSIWRALLDPAMAAPGGWSEVAAVTGPPHGQRNPLPLTVEEDGALLVYRCSESIVYDSTLYAGTRTIDARYAGSATAHVRHAPLIALRGELEDFQSYSYDTGSANDDWYRRDTLGVYLGAATLDAVELERGVTRLAAVLPKFIPATDRSVFIPRSDLHVEHVYNYEAPGAATPRYLIDSYMDSLSTALLEPVLETDTDFTDDLE